MKRGTHLTAKDLRGGVDKRGGGGAGITNPRGNGNIGNVAHQPTDELRNKVRMLVALGNSKDTIAFALDLGVSTLEKYYKLELELGKLEANARVGGAIFSSANGEKVPCVDCEGGRTADGGKCRTCHATGTVWRLEPNTTAQIWWSKNRMGWTDRERIEHVGDGGGPILHEQRDSGKSVHSRLLKIRERQHQLTSSKSGSDSGSA